MNSSSRIRRTHYAAIFLAALWIVLGRLEAPVAALGTCNYNGVCESDNQGNDETCQSCPDDCWAQCPCGDHTCSWPAEGGGYNDCASLPNPSHCSYCYADCGPCFYCWPDVCDGSGHCEPCDYQFDDGDGKCQQVAQDSSYWCGADDECHNSCWTDWNCHYDQWCSQRAACVSECWDDYDCPTAYSCDVPSGTCVPIMT